MVRSSHLFTPLGGLGCVTGVMPARCRVLGDTAHTFVSIGHGYQVLQTDSLGVVFKSETLESSVRSLDATSEGTVVVGLRRSLRAYMRLQFLGEFTGQDHKFDIRGVLCLPSRQVLSWSRHELFAWKLNSREFYRELELPAGCTLGGSLGGGNVVTTVRSYPHKVLVGTDQGEVLLFNTKTGKLIHTMTALASEKTRSVTVLQQNMKHLTVVAVGFDNGDVVLVDFVLDKKLLSVNVGDGECSGVFFREPQAAIGQSETASLLLTSSTSGDISVWDLQTKLLGEAFRAHDPVSLGRKHLPKGVTAMCCVENQPDVFLTSGSDNSLKLWVFDSPTDPTPRVLKQRSGLMGPVTTLSFYADDSLQYLLCAANSVDSSMSSLGLVNTRRANNLHVFSQKQWRDPDGVSAVKGKLPPLLAFSATTNRHFDWPNAVSIHQGSRLPVVWSVRSKALSSGYLSMSKPLAKAVSNDPDFFPSAVVVSPCGNFAIVGYLNGQIHSFNLQSCRHRGHYGAFKQVQLEVEKAEEKEMFQHVPELNLSTVEPHKKRMVDKYHGRTQRLTLPESALSGAIVGLFIINSTTLVGVASEDNCVGYWNLQTFHPLRPPVVVGDPDSTVVLATVSGSLMAVVTACSSVYSLHMLDLVRGQVIRTFGEVGKPSCLRISPDGNLVCLVCGPLKTGPGSEEGGYIMAFDMVTGNLTDWGHMALPILSLEFDSTSTFLYTTHGVEETMTSEDCWATVPGLIRVWANKGAFDPWGTHSRRRVDIPIDLDAAYDVELKVEAETVTRSLKDIITTNQLEPRSLTLSGLPFGRLDALLHVDERRDEGRAEEEVLRPANAPFFLSTAYDSAKTRKFKDDSENEEEVTTTEQSPSRKRVFSEVKSTDMKVKTHLDALLLERRFDDARDHLLSLSPSAIHMACECLDPETTLPLMVEFLTEEAKTRKGADWVQTILSVVLKFHAAHIRRSLPSDDDLAERIAEIRRVMENDWQAIDLTCCQVECYLKFLTHLQLE
ncbi:MAG: uncharacterized protein KVP18_004535 [Porospora cf. gigantea A]|uniref:uncharacterized protein n=2 Tax=Porospora cf. gigantea A TaxID=2853593 RepID=UPI0035599361|nr:MAG: hypothetical protein KVP18_004535 [Porospora cf. gigantea A]